MNSCPLDRAKLIGMSQDYHPVPEPAMLPAGPPPTTSSVCKLCCHLRLTLNIMQEDEYWSAYGDLDFDDSMQGIWRLLYPSMTI